MSTGRKLCARFYRSPGRCLRRYQHVLIQEAYKNNPQEAGGLGQALATLSSQTYWPRVLGIVAAGLIASGIYVIFVIFLGRYRQFDL